MLDPEKVEDAAKVVKEAIKKFEEDKGIPWEWVKVAKDVLATALGVKA